MEESKPFDLSQLFGRERSPDYDVGIRKRIPGYEALHSTSQALLEEALPAKARVLVVGAGTGHELIVCAQARHDWHFLGLDPSQDMLTIAKEKVFAAGVSSRVELHLGTTEDLPTGESFDAATALLVMHFIPEDDRKLAFLAAIHARLKSGGVFLLADMTGRPGSADFNRLFAAWKVHWCAMNGVGKDDPNMQKEFAERMARPGWIDEARHHELFASAGFSDPLRYWSGLLFSAWAMRKG
jgi:tRNA (cmo5U34)-methyltransferase